MRKPISKAACKRSSTSSTHYTPWIMYPTTRKSRWRPSITLEYGKAEIRIVGRWTPCRTWIAQSWTPFANIRCVRVSLTEEQQLGEKPLTGTYQDRIIEQRRDSISYSPSKPLTGTHGECWHIFPVTYENWRAGKPKRENSGKISILTQYHTYMPWGLILSQAWTSTAL